MASRVIVFFAAKFSIKERINEVNKIFYGYVMIIPSHKYNKPQLISGVRIFISLELLEASAQHRDKLSTTDISLKIYVTVKI